MRRSPIKPSQTISEIVDIDIDDVMDILYGVYGFRGWILDLDINPILLYDDCTMFTNKRGKMLYDIYYSKVRDFRRSDLSDDTIKDMFRVCRIFCYISKCIDTNWK